MVRIHEVGWLSGGMPVCGVHKRAVARMNREGTRWHKRYVLRPLDRNA